MLLTSYTKTNNLGDAIQTVALLKLLELNRDLALFRDRDNPTGDPDGETWLLNGYLDGRWKPSNLPTLFTGIHLVNERIIQPNMGDVGARDPHTHALLQRNGVMSTLIGCATMTLPRYKGPRSGTVWVDSGHPDDITQHIHSNMTWKAQLQRAEERLLLLRYAELVHTNRLHVASPCLAFGTPVCMPVGTIKRVSEPNRLSILTEIGFEEGIPQVIDLSEWQVRFTDFLYDRGTLSL